MIVKKICCIGAGYVGGPTMAVIARKCPDLHISVVDKNHEKINAWNSKSLHNLPVYEPGLDKLIKATRNKNLFFSKDIDRAIRESQIIFLAVNTPTKNSGEGKGYAADLTYIEKCAERIAKISMSDKIIVEKSTLPVRTAEKIKEVINVHNKKNNFEVLSNPEFLAEGSAIENLFKSDRVLIGGENTARGNKAVQKLIEIYERWIPKEKILKMNVWSAELSKLASNAMLAQRISSINSFSALSEATGASINDLSKAIGSDKRIGPHFLKPSVGFGGSCFQKDILNLVYLCRLYGLNEVADYWHQVVKINDYQKSRFTKKVVEILDNQILNSRISILGWAYKKNTNDSRESASIYVATNLLEFGAVVYIYDPMVAKDKIFLDISLILEQRGVSTQKVKKLLKNVNIMDNLNDAISNSKAILILTEWDEFKKCDWFKITEKNMFKPFLLDGRNVVDKYYTKKLYSIGI